MLLAFTDGAKQFSDESYLKAAKELANYSLDNLYDWNSSGFFERHSEDKAIYAPGEDLKLTQPVAENGVMSYALLNLYDATKDPRYLHVAMQTIGGEITKAQGLDQAYYYVKAAEKIAIIGYANTKIMLKTIEPTVYSRFGRGIFLMMNV